jgi:hypothetical protein
MSAYICEKKHFVYLIAAAMSPRLSRHSSRLAWFHDGQLHELRPRDRERAAEVANMLYLENIRSVSHRYPGDKSSATLPGTSGGSPITARDFIGSPDIDPVQVLKAIHCLDYQSCEHPGWEASEAHAFLASLSKAAVCVLPGYEAANWGAPETKAAETVFRLY